MLRFEPASFTEPRMAHAPHDGAGSASTHGWMTHVADECHASTVNSAHAELPGKASANGYEEGGIFAEVQHAYGVAAGDILPLKLIREELLNVSKGALSVCDAFEQAHTVAQGRICAARLKFEEAFVSSQLQGITEGGHLQRRDITWTQTPPAPSDVASDLGTVAMIRQPRLFAEDRLGDKQALAPLIELLEQHADAVADARASLQHMRDGLGELISGDHGREWPLTSCTRIQSLAGSLQKLWGLRAYACRFIAAACTELGHPCFANDCIAAAAAVALNRTESRSREGVEQLVAADW
eukprot:SAG11_NODE_2927_length_2832_cov_2.358946_3_plen_297_part_00